MFVYNTITIRPKFIKYVKLFDVDGLMGYLTQDNMDKISTHVTPCLFDGSKYSTKCLKPKFR